MSADDRDGRAGEYVLGTLPAAERRAFEAEMALDPVLANLVTAWERRLGGLAAAVPAVAPPPGLLGKVEARIKAQVAETQAVPLRRELSPALGERRLIDELKRRIAVWRTAASLSGAVAIGLAAVLLGGNLFRVPAEDDNGQRFVAVVDRDGTLPALLVDVNTGTGIVSVLSVASEAPPGRSYELWYIGAGQNPYSLGIIDDTGQRLAFGTGEIAGFMPAGATFAITEEPLGGSPTGVATGPVVYSGVLVPVE